MRKAEQTTAEQLQRRATEQREIISAHAAGLDDRVVSRHLRATLHFRTYLPIYVLGTVWVLILALFPAISSRTGGTEVTAAGGSTAENFDGGGFDDEGFDGDGGGSFAGAGTASAGGSGGSTAAGGSGSGSGGGGAGGDGGSGGGSGSAGGGGNGGGATAASAPGQMRDGRMCEPGVLQIEGSTYAAPCRPIFEGDNGGATYRGVTEDKIIVVRRGFPESANSRAVAAFAEQAGAASADDSKRVRLAFQEYFAANYELYGRTVEIIEYESQHGNSTAEAQSQGREGACLDAEQIVKEIGAFAVAIAGGSQPFAECAAQRGLVVLDAAGYFPESFYRRHSPYLWNTTMNCEKISYQTGEYIVKRLAGREARWARDPLLRGERTFGVYVPNNAGYQHCVDIVESEMNKGGAEIASRYNYTLDVSRFPDEAARGIIQFKRAGVTTVVLACDPISAVFLTQQATSQQYRPEWFLIGVALTDVEQIGRLYDQSQANGSMFGMSQLGTPHALQGPESEPGQVYQRISGEQIPDATTGGYFSLMNLFNLLQAAGPDLTPENLRRGAFSLPDLGAPHYPAGKWSYRDGPDGTPGARSHTAVSDAREVYWDGTARGFDGDLGAFIETYDGRRFGNGEWPAEEPPVYP